MITEDQLEQPCLDWFSEGSYEYANGYDIAHDGKAAEREGYKQVLLTSRLFDALQRINPQILVATLEEQVVHVLSKPVHPVLIQNNRNSQQYCSRVSNTRIGETQKSGNKLSYEFNA